MSEVPSIIPAMLSVSIISFALGVAAEPYIPWRTVPDAQIILTTEKGPRIKELENDLQSMSLKFYAINQETIDLRFKAIEHRLDKLEKSNEQ